MPLVAGGGAACVVVVGGGVGAFVVVGCGDGFGAGLATFATFPDVVWDGGLAAVAPLLPPPHPATTNATIGTAAAPARNWMDLVRIMGLLWLSDMTARLRAWGVSGMGIRPRLPPPGTPGRRSGKPYPREGVSAEPDCGGRASPRPWASFGFSLPECERSGEMIAAMERSILVVDDDPTFRELARRILADAGLKVVAEADSAAAAISAAKAMKPEGALVDVDLPDRDGIALAQELTALPWRPRVVLTSVDPDAAAPDDVRRSGALAFFPKAELANGTLRSLLASD